ncbi:MAG TPA: hypothetical protein VHX60_16280 [Acidobacteriaceae bacterium]|jgi:hypothetical protein|nr:hypothetical protein [Acidobacteriaceae bacterium]
MSTLIMDDTEPTASVDDFSVLEERILRTVELVRTERAARVQADENAAHHQSLVDAQQALLAQAQEQVRTLERDREQVRHRVERLLKQLDEISA